MKECQNLKTKAELSQYTWNKIKRMLQQMKLSQSDLVKLCKEHGYNISQPEISRLYSGKLQLNLYQLAAFADVLGVSADYLIYEKEIFHRLHVDGRGFITNPSDAAFDGYLGTYETIFSSTSPFDQKILQGKMTFKASKKNDICQAAFELDTGHVDPQGEAITKRYQGQLIISKRLNIAYCILINDTIGEISMVEFRHRSFLVNQAECRLGLVLTAASGENKLPVTHRMFLSRTPLEEKTLQKILPYLKQESEEILISRTDFEAVLKESDNFGYDFNRLLNENPQESYLAVNEWTLRRINRKLSRFQIAEILSLLRKHSTGQYNLFLRVEDDNGTYDILRQNNISEDKRQNQPGEGLPLPDG